jgi:hypothetical protein
MGTRLPCREQSSLPGLWFVFKNCKRFWANRRWVQDKRRVPEQMVRCWLSTAPKSFPLEADLREQLERPEARSRGCRFLPTRR